MGKMAVIFFVLLAIMSMFVTSNLALADNSLIEIIELSAQQEKALLDAPPRYIATHNNPVVDNEIQHGIADSVRVERLHDTAIETGADSGGRDSNITHQGWIFYKPVSLSETREYRPVILCIAHDKYMTWIACQDESWTKVQTSIMTRSIRLDGRLSDEGIEAALQYVDQLNLISKRDNSPISADSIHHIVGLSNPHENGDGGARLFSRTQVDGYWDAIDLMRISASDEEPIYELENFRSGS